MREKILIWRTAIRPKTLPAAVAPVLIGGGLALESTVFNGWAWLAALTGAILIQIAANLINDVADYEKGADTKDRLGPTRVTQAGMLKPKQVWVGVWVSFGLTALVGLYLISVGGTLILWIGLASILGALAYTVGPYPLAYIGLADIFVMVFFGFVAVLGTEYVTGGSISFGGWGFGAAIGALIVNILVVNNIRDIETDRAAGRRNLPVVFGRKAAEIEYILMLGVAYLVPVGLVLTGIAPWLVLVNWITLPFGMKLMNQLRGGLAGAPLNAVLGQTAQLAFRYAALSAIGYLVNWFVGLL